MLFPSISTTYNLVPHIYPNLTMNVSPVDVDKFLRILKAINFPQPDRITVKDYSGDYDKFKTRMIDLTVPIGILFIYNNEVHNAALMISKIVQNGIWHGFRMIYDGTFKQKDVPFELYVVRQSPTVEKALVRAFEEKVMSSV